METEICDTVVLAAPITDASKFAFDKRKFLLREEREGSSISANTASTNGLVVIPRVRITRPKYNVRMCN